MVIFSSLTHCKIRFWSNCWLWILIVQDLLVRGWKTQNSVFEEKMKVVAEILSFAVPVLLDYFKSIKKCSLHQLSFL